MVKAKPKGTFGGEMERRNWERERKFGGRVRVRKVGGVEVEAEVEEGMEGRFGEGREI